MSQVYAYDRYGNRSFAQGTTSPDYSQKLADPVTGLPVSAARNPIFDLLTNRIKVTASEQGGYDYFPFGDEIQVGTGGRATGSGYGVVDNMRQHFGSKERDDETGLDFFVARYYSDAQGRFTSTDPIVMAPERATDPQQLNLYSYTRNNPLKFIDPDGEIINEPTGLSERDQKRYDDWKNRLLSTTEGQKLWDKYRKDQNFTLDITLTDRGSDQANKGAITGGYKFDQQGNLVGAAITLGNNLGGGTADPVYYPVQSRFTEVDAHTLAAAKIAHEFGHVEDARARAGRFAQEQPFHDAYTARLNALLAAQTPSQTIFTDPTLTGIRSQYQAKFGNTLDDSKEYRELRAESLAVPVIRQLVGSSAIKEGVKDLQRRFSVSKYKP